MPPRQTSRTLWRKLKRGKGILPEQSLHSSPMPIHNHDSPRYNCVLRVAFVGYRDHNYGPKRIESMDFADSDAFRCFLEGIGAMGSTGRDTCEDVHGGLEAAINLSWNSKYRVLIHIADAPAHGSRFHGFPVASEHDDYAKYNESDLRGLKMEDLIAKIKRLGIDYTFGKINKWTDIMIQEFRSIGGDSFVRCSDMADLKNFPFAAVETITATIQKSMVGSVRSATTTTAISESSSKKKLKAYTIVAKEPGWKRVRFERVRMGRCKVRYD